MPTRMKTIYLRGLLWLYFLGFGCVVVCVEPGYLDFDNLPDTNFSCVGKVIGGYYADLETNCQMFHVCTIGQLDEPMDIRFLCLNGTVFDQETRVCERIDEVDCTKSEQFYSLNLELYGNTQPSVSDDNSETDPPIIIKASTTTTTTTTTTPKPTTKSTSPPVVTTSSKVISAHHFPVSGSSDIRFNPEEINISLNPGAAPNIRAKTVAYQQQVFNNDNKKVVVTTSYGTEKEDFIRVVPNTQRPQVSTQKIKVQSPATPADINYGFTYHQTESTIQPHNYQYHHAGPTYRQFRNQFKTTTYRTEHLTTTRKEPIYQTYKTEKPQRLQLPLPLLPTLPPLMFSSPAPFSLGHVDAKRYTNDHQPPPRIIISASASVSDNSGRRLNYSLGTIGVTPLLEEPPKSYDEYKDHDVVLDPFYHDVPKIKTRRKRQAPNNEQAAVDVLKFLFDWYNSQQKTTVKIPIPSEDITEINQQLAPIVEPPIVDSENETSFKDSALFQRKNKFNIVGDVLSVTETQVSSEKPSNSTNSTLDTADYVDDNYEAVPHQKESTTLPLTTTTTEPTTTSRIMGVLRKRAQAHHDRIMKENKQKYSSSLNNLRPKIRNRGKLGITGRSHNTKKLSTTTPTIETELVTTKLFDGESQSTFFPEEFIESTTEITKLKEETTNKKNNDFVPVTQIPIKEVEHDQIQEETKVDFNKENDNKMSDSMELEETIIAQNKTSSVKNETQILEAFEKNATNIEESTISEEITEVNTEEAIETTTLYEEVTDAEEKTEIIQSNKQPKTESEVLENKTSETTGFTSESTTELEDMTVFTTTVTNFEDLTEKVTESELYQTTATESTTLSTTTEEVINLTPAATTTTETAVTTSKPNYRKSKSRHRFSTELNPKKPVEDEIVDVLTTTTQTQDEILPTSPKIPSSTLVDFSEDISATDAPLSKSANPTQAESAKESLHTTPLSMLHYKMQIRKGNARSFIFNCFGKDLNKFYSDPRDCRLFHYCTSGYTKNQLLDMKFVCDLGTYFDDEKLICTKTKPERCL